MTDNLIEKDKRMCIGSICINDILDNADLWIAGYVDSHGQPHLNTKFIASGTSYGVQDVTRGVKRADKILDTTIHYLEL
jgi:hypothetical protein